MRPMPCVLLWQQARTAMHMAAIHSRVLILEDLLAAGADPDARDKVAAQFVPHLVPSFPRYLYHSRSSLQVLRWPCSFPSSVSVAYIGSKQRAGDGFCGAGSSSCKYTWLDGPNQRESEGESDRERQNESEVARERRERCRALSV